MSSSPIEVSVVMPCLNEAQTLKVCITKALECFKTHNISGEVVIADNGSTDGSQQIAKACGARVVEQPIKGYGAALRKGFEAAHGRFIVMGDADDSYDFLQTHRFVEKLREGYDVVMGTRLKGEIKPGAMPWLHRYFGNPVLTFILNFLFNSGISDAHCGLRGFTKKTVEQMDLRTTGMEFASEIVIKAVRNKLKMTEIPVVLSPDGRNRRPHLRSFHDGWRHLRMMLMLAPDMLFINPGIILCFAGLILQICIFLFGPISLGALKLAENTMVFCMVAALIGLQMLYLGLFSYLFMSTGISTINKQQNIILTYSKFEKGVIIGLILLFIGIVGDALVLQRWHAVEFGRLDLFSIRQSIFSSTIFILGLQIVLSSFFLNMVGVERAIYAGETFSKSGSENK